ncbi:unnamed protein product [Kluyveromyces dobzhanskii CBS 2104]|uniref:WGS project CCBQ000000000 data, contig 00015 n=1 Tax=Kluyveromyces dobzhanskii CBS 2104 TaxID=1427455 RepID=A0A0A8LAJ7_9SACH|nr:unnamed protein product [Kluyveromyces dobzhanskii CBS 2104]
MQQHRVVSTASSVSTASLGETFQFGTLDKNYSLCDDLDLVYSEVLKVVLLEYINEPRFRRKWRPVSLSNSSPKLRVRSANNDSNARLSTWFSNDSADDNEDDGNRTGSDSVYTKESMKQVLNSLELKLTRVAINQDLVNDAMLRRSLLKFYNDVFLDSQVKNTLQTMATPEDLIILFVKSANKELTKMETEDLKSNLFHQMSRFINILIECSRNCKMGPTYVKRLNAYKGSLKQGNTKKSSPTPMSGNAAALGAEQSNLVDDTLQPTFRLSEITHVKILMPIFEVDELKLQRDVIRLSSLVKNDLYLKELSKYEQIIKKDQAELQAEHFDSEDQYNEWKTVQLKTVKELKEKATNGLSGHNEAGKNSTGDVTLIPNDPRRSFRTLVNLILKHEFTMPQSEPSFSISLDAKFLLSKCLRYWLLDHASCKFTNAVSGSLHLIPKLEFSEGMRLIQYVFNFAETKVSVEAPEQADPLTWNKRDQEQWLSNQVTLFLWMTDEVDQSIGQMFKSSGKGPKLKTLMSTYTALVEHDPVLGAKRFQKCDLYKKQIYKLKKRTFRTVEQRYIQLLRNVPTDKEINIKHLHDLCESILDDIAKVEIKYKPLTNLSTRYDFISIVTRTYATALFRDLKVLMQRINKYNQPIDSDALDTYKLLNELRWKDDPESGSRNRDGSTLESIFYQNLLDFCEKTGDVMKRGCERIVAHETWEPMDKEAEQWYSRSAYDISRLISDTLRLVDQLQWNDLPQLATAYSIILGKASECIVHYARSMEDLIIEDLSIQEDDEQSANRSAADLSLLKEMKSAIQSSKLWNSHWKRQFQGNKKEGASPSTAPVPATGYVISLRSCVCLNNMESIMTMIDDVEKSFQLKGLSEELRAHVTTSNTKVSSEIKGQMWSVVPIAAESIPQVGNKENPQYSLSIVDTKRQHEIYRTLPGGFPGWWDDEELDLELEAKEKMSLALVLWQEKHHSGLQGQRSRRKYKSGNSSGGSGFPVGRCYLDLDMPRDMLKPGNKKAGEGGHEKSLSLPLDTQGRIHVRVSLEVERAEPDCITGKTRRIVAKILSQSLKQVTNRFEPRIQDAFSKKTLASLMSGFRRTTERDTSGHGNGVGNGVGNGEDDIYDSIVPLFEKLNENLTVLAQALPTTLLHQVMLQVWDKILAAADALLLPPVQLASFSSSSLYNAPARTVGTASVWDTAVSGFQKVLQKPSASGTAGSLLEVEIVFMWIDILCKDFFHNDGAGPPLSQLKNGSYQDLMLIASMFDTETRDLKRIVEQDSQPTATPSQSASGSLSQPVVVALRILWARGDHKYVANHAQSRGRSIRAAVAKLRITSGH